jgi:hypothetical protein
MLASSSGVRTRITAATISENVRSIASDAAGATGAMTRLIAFHGNDLVTGADSKNARKPLRFMLSTPLKPP